MRNKHRYTILAIPGIETLATNQRNLIQTCLRRRSEGAVTLHGTRVGGTEENPVLQVKALWAIFEDRRQVVLVLQELEQIFAFLKIDVVVKGREEFRQAPKEAPCCCVLESITYGSIRYQGMGQCERHASLAQPHHQAKTQICAPAESELPVRPKASPVIAPALIGKRRPSPFSGRILLPLASGQ